jgi:hypothetical protein
MRRARERIREVTERKRLSQSVEVIVQELNRFLRGWGGYFRYGHSARHFDQISTYALKRLASGAYRFSWAMASAFVRSAFRRRRRASSQ